MTVHQVVVVLDVNAPDLVTAGRCATGILNGTRGWLLEGSDSHLESWWMPEEPLRSEVDGNDNPHGRLILDCQTCGGSGELTECVNDGTHGCSHVNDKAGRCDKCLGSGEIPLRADS